MGARPEGHLDLLTTWFRPVAVVMSPRPGEFEVRVIGRTSTNADRFEGLDDYIQSGDPQMPAWAEARVARLQTAANPVLAELARR